MSDLAGAFTPRKADYKLSALNKKTEHKGNIGGAWINKDGSITIKLNSFVVLSAADNLAITLFPNNDEGPRNRKKSADDIEDPYHE